MQFFEYAMYIKKKTERNILVYYNKLSFGVFFVKNRVKIGFEIEHA